VIARIEDERLLLDLRTVFLEEEDALAAALSAVSIQRSASDQRNCLS